MKELFLRKYVEYLYKGTRCFDMDACFEDETDCYSKMSMIIDTDPDSILDGLYDDKSWLEDAETDELIEMFKKMTNG